MIHCHFIPMDQNRHLFFNLLFIVPSYKGLIKTDNLGKYGMSQTMFTSTFPQPSLIPVHKFSVKKDSVISLTFRRYPKFTFFVDKHLE